MDKAAYEKLESYMLACMEDAAHDKEHVYRVLYAALDIAAHERGANLDVLIAACLLHDIGLREQFADPAVDHAEAGAVKAVQYLTANGSTPEFAAKVAGCIRAHRFRNAQPPSTIEEKILFDADKLDAAGVIGIARTICYQAIAGQPLYSTGADGSVLPGAAAEPDSFLREYKFKLERLYGHFFTRRGAELARRRQAAAVNFYQSLMEEIVTSAENGRNMLAAAMER